MASDGARPVTLRLPKFETKQTVFERMGLTGINDEFEASRRTFTSCDPNLTMAVGSDAGDCQDLGQEIDKLPFVQVARSGQVNGRFVGRKRLTGLGLKKRKADLRSGGPNEGSERLLLWTIRKGRF